MQGLSGKYSPQSAEREIQERRRALEEEEEYFTKESGNFNRQISEWIHDCMNLMFGGQDP